MTPPDEYLSWLDYAVATMDARGAYLDCMFDGAVTPSQEEVMVAAIEELNHLRRMATMPWVGMLENWLIRIGCCLSMRYSPSNRRPASLTSVFAADLSTGRISVIKRC